MAAGENIHFSIPTARLAGFKQVMRESNAAAREYEFTQLQPRRDGDAIDGAQPMVVRIKERTRCLISELLGFIQDIEDGRHFQRTAESARYW